MLLTVIIPIIIGVLWISFLANLSSIRTLTDIFVAFIFLIVLPAGYGLFLWWLKKPTRERAESYEKTQRILSYRIGSGEYDYIYVNLQNCRASCHRPDGSSSPFSFSEYGYQTVNSSSVLGILRNLEYRLDGYLTVQYKDFTTYDPSITVTHGTMPGGGDGYYVNVGSYDTVSIPTYAYLYLGEMARQKRREDKKRDSIFK